MKSLKRFIDKKKADSKFSSAGHGRKLTDEGKTAPSSSSRPSGAAAARPQSASSARAGAAALARFESETKKVSAPPKSKTAIWKSGNPSHVVSTQSEPVGSAATVAPVQTSSSNLYPSSFSFLCPFCNTSHSGDIVMDHMKECLLQEMESDATVASALMIHSLNEDATKRKACIEYLSKYLTNIIDHPDEVKYRKIKTSNRVFKERVAPLTGVIEFLLKGCGFEEKDIDLGENEPVTHYVIEEISTETIERLKVLLELLREAEPLRPSLDRQHKVFSPSQASVESKDVDSNFFKLSSKEIKHEQFQRTKNIEESKQLRTKAMREVGSHTVGNNSKYTLIRVRFPDDTLLQGAFNSRDKVEDVMTFVRECSEHDWIPFNLSVMGGNFLLAEKQLSELGLVPAALLVYRIDKEIEENFQQARKEGTLPQYLKKELLDN